MAHCCGVASRVRVASKQRFKLCGAAVLLKRWDQLDQPRIEVRQDAALLTKPSARRTISSFDISILDIGKQLCAILKHSYRSHQRHFTFYWRLRKTSGTATQSCRRWLPEPLAV